VVTDEWLLDDSRRLLAVVQEVSRLRDLAGVMEVVRRAARALTGADGVTFVLREGQFVYYADEDAIAPLWKGRRFPAASCISGWAIANKQSVVIEDIYADARIPHDAYRATFVKSLVMVPIREADPVGAIGAYWARPHRATPREVGMVQTLASSTAIAMVNAELHHAAQEALRVREEFMSVAAHELRTPLTSLVLETQAFLRHADRGELAPPIAARMERFDRQLTRLGQLVNDLVDVARLVQGRPGLNREEMELSEVVRQVLSDFSGLAERHATPLRFSSSSEAIGWWDPLRLETIVSNLVGNALKYGAGKPVEVELSGDERICTLVVRDQGIGIAVEDQARIFERFERAVPGANYVGLGLGLWIVRQLVEAHGGTIAVDSRPGEGARFTLKLPRAVPRAS
jgi:signal transduction histidine kinase